MISQKIQKALQGSSAIRAMFVEGNELAARVGRENVYDFSLGNPATPAPAALNEAIKQLVEGLIVITAGSDVLRFVPPLIIEKQHVDEMIGKLKKALDQM